MANAGKGNHSMGKHAGKGSAHGSRLNAVKYYDEKSWSWLKHKKTNKPKRSPGKK